MKYRTFQRALMGAPIGLVIFVSINLLLAHLRGDGELRIGYYLISVYGNEVNAATALVLGAMVIGMIWSAASVIFDTEWSLLVQTAVHAGCCVIPSMAIAWSMYWIPRSWDGIMQYAGAFCVLYVLIGLIRFLTVKSGLRRINNMLPKYQSEE